MIERYTRMRQSLSLPPKVCGMYATSQLLYAYVTNIGRTFDMDGCCNNMLDTYIRVEYDKL